MSDIETAADARFFRRVNALETGRERSAFPQVSMADYLAQLAQVTFGYSGQSYTLPLTTQSGQKQESPDGTLTGYTQAVYKADGIVSAVTSARTLLLSETTFKWRNVESKNLFGTPALRLLEEPWPNGTTGELLTRMEQDITLAGNAYVLARGGRLWRLRPDCVSILLTSQFDPDHPEFAWDASVVGYLYKPYNGGTSEVFTPREVAHWSPMPDPLAHYKGMSWLTPVIREVMADQAATDHKSNFFANAATPNLAIKLPESVKSAEQFKELKEAMDSTHSGSGNAWKTLYLAAGADVQVVGARLQDLDYKALQGVYETRICNAARVPAVVAGVSEGLAGSSLNAGNFSQARRLFVDGWYRPHVRSLCSALGRLVKAPAGSHLWYDDTDIGFLREDLKDAAEIDGKQASAIRQHIEAGFDPDAAIAAVLSHDISKLTGTHTGLTSVQLAPPVDGSDGRATTAAEREDVLEITQAIQKIYLGVTNGLLTAEEARRIVNRLGAGLDGPAPADNDQPIEPAPDQAPDPST